ncbi:MAG: tetratricopeptide repeat protein [bacterium]
MAIRLFNSGKKSVVKISFIIILSLSFSLMLYGCGLSQVGRTDKLKSNLYYRIGSGYFNSGNYVKALQEFIRAETVNPYSAKNYNAIGTVYMMTHRQNKAIKYFNKAVSINKKFSYAYYNLAMIYIKTKNYSLAAANLKSALANPFYNEPYQAYTLLGKIYIIQNKFKKAKRYLLISQALNKKYFLTYYYLGNYYSKKDDFAEAIINYRKVLKIDAYFVPAQFKEAESYFKLKKYKKSYALFKKIYSQNKLNIFGIKASGYLNKIKKMLY